MATIKEVAKLAGVSISTVSRALSGKVFVEEATRQRVLKAVGQLSYRPNFMAKGLKQGHSQTLALVLPDILNPFFPTLIKYLERHAAARGYSLILYDSGEDSRQEKKYMDALASHYVDGVVYASTSDDLSPAIRLRERGVPVVALGREAPELVCVTSDNRAGARAVIDHLVAHGHRRIACLAAPMAGHLRYRQRHAGCLDAFREHGIDGHRRYMAKNVSSIEDAYLRSKKLLSRPDRPTAVFVFYDMMAMGVYSAAHDCGLDIPADLSVAGFDNIYLSRNMIPPLTTYEQPADQLARIALDRLIAQIEGPERPAPEIIEVKGGLIVRQSVGETA